MKTNRIAITALLAASTFVAGCAAPGYPQASSPYPAPAGQQGVYASYGVVDSIQVVNSQSGPGGIGAGTVVGGLVGGLLGNQVGGGTGRGLATAAGVIGGAVAGNQIEKRTTQATAYQIGVRLDNGAYQTYTQESIGDLNIGNRVRVDNGRVYRY
ncbi:MAG: glycine zipper 2TM domain-containing protein [Oxalobacteraceae bacterium]|nr:MAG: glycine zipper 2TM domain-containing protein [Oxalobacteraceae bacterium]